MRCVEELHGVRCIMQGGHIGPHGVPPDGFYVWATTREQERWWFRW